MIKKPFFREPTAAKIKDLGEMVVAGPKDYFGALVNLHISQPLLISGRLIPEDFETPRKFMKHGKEVRLSRARSLREVKDTHKAPFKLRDEAFRKLDNGPYCGYTDRPYWGDRRLRKYTLVYELEGAHIIAFAHQILGIEPKNMVYPLVDAKRARRDGGTVIVKNIPSTEEDVHDYEIRFDRVPVVDTLDKWGLAHTLRTDHSCPYKRFNIRYKYEDEEEGSDVDNLCLHEVAGYFAITEHFWYRDANLVPLDMSQFAFPTQLMVDIYDKIRFNTLIMTPMDKKPRKPHMGERESIVWRAVKEFGPNATFFAVEPLKKYKWRCLDDVVSE